MWRLYEDEDVGSYWMALRERKDVGKLKEEALDHTQRRNGFGKSCKTLLRQK